MGTFIVAAINVIFILFVYTVFSKRVRALEKKRLPDELRAEINGLITDFNQTADTNVTLLEDRISRLQPLLREAASRAEELEGQISRAELLLRDLRRPESVSGKQTKKPASPKKAVPAAPPEDPLGKKRAFSSYGESAGLKKAGTKTNRGSASAAKSRTRKKSIQDKASEKIRKLAEKGATVDEIAQKTGFSVQQVEMRLAFGNFRDSKSSE